MPRKKATQTKRPKRSPKKQESFTLIPSPIKPQQLLHIIQRTPSEHVYLRPAKGGGEWEYVTGVYVKKVLNYVFGWLWDFEIRDKGREGDLVWVQGRLTIKNKSGKEMIVKEQFGRADIKYQRGKPHKPENMIDYGNDLKAAATDSLKKCASELGIASDIYGSNEFKDIQKVDKGFTPPENGSQQPVQKTDPAEAEKKVSELKKMLKGETDQAKLADLKKRAGISLRTFDITARHASILIANLLNAEAKK